MASASSPTNGAQTAWSIRRIYKLDEQGDFQFKLSELRVLPLIDDFALPLCERSGDVANRNIVADGITTGSYLHFAAKMKNCRNVSYGIFCGSGRENMRSLFW